MCGIVGIYNFSENGKNYNTHIENAVNSLRKRGPDSCGIENFNNCSLGHTRLSVIDTSNFASQPLSDYTNRYYIIFNGEFYNYKEHRNLLENEGVRFKSNSDTEVLLYLFIKHGPDFIKLVNGCFAIAIYDNLKEELYLYRDRYGIKPLLIYQDSENLIFASELKAILEFNVKKELDYTSIYQYFQLNYIPSSHSVFKDIYKLEPGSYMFVSKKGIDKNFYYYIPYKESVAEKIPYDDSKLKLSYLLDKSVERRLVSDVPLGAFLSGGIDSSVITAIASKYVKKLNTFSIGYKDEKFYDETNYAELVAKKFNTNHTVFKLTNNDLFEHFNSFMDYIDEPFADSSALAVHILSQETKKHVTVALSGDGADELFSGYNKHYAHFNSNKKNLTNFLLKTFGNTAKYLPKSRSNKLLNNFRKLERYSSGLKLNPKDRYWRWCSINEENEALKYFNFDIDISSHLERKNIFTEKIKGNSINEILYSDFKLVLQSDMLHKVDLMSMGNGLEVRVPFLDYTVVDFVFSLPENFKINNNIRKRILQDTYREILPQELYNRPKHGFEVPLIKWFNNELKSTIEYLLSKKFIDNQNIFDYTKIESIKNNLKSSNHNEVQAQIWALIVFQHWWKKYID